MAASLFAVIGERALHVRRHKRAHIAAKLRDFGDIFLQAIAEANAGIPADGYT